MSWTVYLARFAAGFVLANGVPHFVNGISGKKFQTPFARPAGMGESSPVVNVLWGMLNFAVGYALIVSVGDFVGGLSMDVVLLGLGALVGSLGLAWHFGRVRRR